MKRSGTFLFLRLALIGLLWPHASVAQPEFDSSYWGALEYRVPLLHGTALHVAGHSPNVAQAYKRLDRMMRTTDSITLDREIRSVELDDTLRRLVSALYRMIDDDPVLFRQYDATVRELIRNRPLKRSYSTSPDHLRKGLERRVRTMLGDSLLRTAYLLETDLILHLRIDDTLVIERQGSGYYAPMVPIILVTATILDAIKGERIPVPIGGGLIRSTYERSSPRQAYVQSATVARAKLGTKIVFQGLGHLKPGDECIAFLYCEAIRSGARNTFVALEPIWDISGNGVGGYAIENGIVYDPLDDFKLGGKELPVNEWIKRLRARIARTILK